jgi:hypothetical protein
MSLDDNKAIIRAFVETVWNGRQLDRADEVVAGFRLANGRIAEHLGAAGSAGLNAAARRRPGPGMRTRPQQAVRLQPTTLVILASLVEASASSCIAVLATSL